MEFYQFKQHFRKNKKLYTGVAISATSASVVFFTYIMMRDHSQPIRVAISEPAQGAISVLGKKVEIKNSTLNTVSYISANRRGSPSWIIRCKETGNIFISQKAAATEMGLPQAHISLHLNGKMDHVRGFTFERIAMAA